MQQMMRSENTAVTPIGLGAPFWSDYTEKTGEKGE